MSPIQSEGAVSGVLWMAEVLASVSDAVFVIDAHGNSIFMNPRAESLSGWKQTDAMGLPVGDIIKFSIDDDIQTVLSSSPYVPVQSPQEFTGRISLVRKDGSKNPVKGRSLPFLSEDGSMSGTIILFSDATIEHHLVQAKDHFLSIVAHQLRTPLGSARWCMDMLLSGDFGDVSQEAREAIIKLYASNQQMVELVNDLLDMAKFNRTQGVEESISVDAVAVVDNIFRFLELDAQRHRVTLERKSDSNPPKLFVPRRRFYEVVRNLISNAVKYSYPGGHVLVEIISNNERCRLSVRDQGIGIPPDEQPNIFSKFFRASNAVRSQTEGSGLGLAVVKLFVESWGGQVGFESVENKGTTFFIDLPLEASREKVVEENHHL